MALKITSSATNAVLGANASIRDLRVTIGVEHIEASGIYTDPDSKNKVLVETVALSEVTALFTIKVLADSTSLADVTLWVLNKGVADSLSASDTFSRVVVYRRTFSDAFVLGDTSLIAKDFQSSKDNDFGIADVNTLGFTKPLSESVGFGDVATYDQAKVFSDTMPVIDSAAIYFTASLPTDYISIADTSTQNLNKGVPDTLAVSDTFSRTVVYSRTFSDTFVLDDAALIDKNYYGNKDNAFGITDVNALGFTKPLSDSFSVGDALQLAPTKNIPTDAISLTDSIQLTPSIGLTDFFTFTDPLTVDLSMVMAPDSMSMSDTISILHISASSRINASPFNVATFNS